jgi:hypothetical protein
MTISQVVFFAGVLLLLAMQLRSFFYLRRMRRHDRVLFRFCQIRRDAMALLRTRFESGGLTRSQYRAVRLLLICLNDIIRHYHGQGAMWFNLRVMRREFTKYGITAARLRRIADSPEIAGAMRAADGDADIRNLYNDFFSAHVRAVIAYTPFIYAEVLLRIFAKEAAKELELVRADAKKFGVSFYGGAIAQ